MDVNRDSKWFNDWIDIVLIKIIYLDFYDVLPAILKDINEADYVAIDGEFTGILSFDKMNYFDTPSERYKRHYEVRIFQINIEDFLKVFILVW